MKLNKINFGLLILLFLCRFENILGVSDKNIEEGLKEKYKIVDLNGTTLKNEQGEDFSFIVTCKCDGSYYKWFEGIESDIEKIEGEEDSDNRNGMVKELEGKSGGVYLGDIVKTQDGRVLVVKDEIKDKIYLVLGKYDKGNSKTDNIFLDKNCNLQTSSLYDIIKEENIASVVIGAKEDCGGKLLNNILFNYKFPIVCCKLKKEVVVDSCCCGCLGSCFKNLCP